MKGASAFASTQRVWCDQELAQHVVEKCHWIETAVLAATAALILIAMFAFSQQGAFASTGIAVPFGSSCLIMGFSLFLGEVIYKTFLYCRAKSTHQQQVYIAPLTA